MKILVTGANGQLGSDVLCELAERGHQAVVSDIHDTFSVQRYIGDVYPVHYLSIDITDPKAVQSVIKDIRPDAIVHCAAWTNVDRAEDPDNQKNVYKINTEGTRNIALAAKAVDAKLIYISTDYVFDGQGDRPWQPDDKNYAPLNYYGRTKLDGELAVADILEKYYIVRIAWVFGLNGRNFVSTMADLGKAHDTIRVVNDQIGTPTYTKDLARLLVDMVETDKYGYYHATNEGGYISWYDYAFEIFRQSGIDVDLIPVTTEEYGVSVAKRPMNSRLDKSKLGESGFISLPDWKDALKRYLKEADL